jgi:hypothetical protein
MPQTISKGDQNQTEQEGNLVSNSAALTIISAIVDFTANRAPANSVWDSPKGLGIVGSVVTLYLSLPLSSSSTGAFFLADFLSFFPDFLSFLLGAGLCEA